MISADPLTGRDSEFAFIRRALTGAGNHSGVVIAGAAGVGKTWLAREALRRAEAAGERTKWIVGTESARALPLGAFIGELGEAMSDPLTNVRRVINSFVAQQRRGRVLVGVDDAHLLDGLSALIVHELAQSGGARLVVTMRTGFTTYCPVGRGLFEFDNYDEALAAIDSIAADYPMHSRAARELAWEYFRSERVIGELMSAAGL